MQEKEQLEVYMGNKYQQSFYQMVEHIEQLQVLLGKTLVSTSPRQNIMLLTDVWSHANMAQSELNKLPLAAQTVYQTSKFLNQTGDYAHVMAKQNAEGKVLTAENRETLRKLRDHAIQVSRSLIRLQNQTFAGDVNWLELIKGTKQRVKDDGGQEEDPINGGFDDIREELNKFPTLIYDGPFSDHINETEPKGLTGNKISRESAREKAEEYVDFRGKDDINVSEGNNVKGRIPSYNFSVSREGEGEYSVDIAQKGGHLVSMLTNREIGNKKISEGEAIDKARDYLAAQGYPNMQPTYAENRDSLVYISFAYKQDGVIFYPDIINVQVALDNGQVLAVNATGYLMSHHEREVPEAKISETEAKRLASSTLTEIESVRPAVIPTASKKEVFTIEVRGQNQAGETYLIYLNAKTGDEEQVLKVVKDNKGTFAL